MGICRIEQAVWHIFNSDTALSASVGGRIYHDVGSVEDGFPLIVINLQRVEPYGNLVTTSPAAVSTVEVVTVSTSREGASNIADAVRLLLDRYHDNVTLSNGDTCFIHCAVCGHTVAQRTPNPDGNDLGLSSTYITFTITHQLEV